MPHLWDMVDPAVRSGGRPLGATRCGRSVLAACLFSLQIAALGWLIGVVVGIGLALLMQRVRIAEAAILPWVVLSQTVPLIAIAPLVRRWGSQIKIGELRMGERVLGRGDRGLPRLLPGRGRGCCAGSRPRTRPTWT